MRRALIVVLTVALLSVLPAVPVGAHEVSYQKIKGGYTECGVGQEVATRIYAVGHHKHVGWSSVTFHYGTSWNTSVVKWDVVAMNWALYNQAGLSYSSTGTYGYCTTAS